MTIRDLEIFLTVVESGTMSAAAKKLNISQPSISQSIAQIEQEYNVILFDRISRKLFLTASGKELLVYAQKLLHEVNTMKESLLLSPNLHTFVVGSSLTIHHKYLQNLIQELEKHKGALAIQCIMEDSLEIEKKIQNDELEVAIVEGLKVKKENWEYEFLFEDRLYVICAKDHPLAHHSTLTIEALRNQPLAIRERGTNIRRFVLSTLRQHVVPVQLAWVCSGYESIFSVVENHQAISLVPGSSLTTNKNVVAIPLEGTPSTCRFYVGYRTDCKHTHLVEETVKKAKEIFKEENIK